MIANEFPIFEKLSSRLISMIIDHFISELGTAVAMKDSVDTTKGQTYDKLLVDLIFNTAGKKTITKYEKYDSFIVLYTSGDLDTNGTTVLKDRAKIVLFDDIIEAYNNDTATTIPNCIVPDIPSDATLSFYKMNDGRFEVLINSATAGNSILDLGITTGFNPAITIGSKNTGLPPASKGNIEVVPDKVTLTIVFDPNNGESAKSATTDLAVGDNYQFATLKAMIWGTTDPTYSGYSFAGWSTEKVTPGTATTTKATDTDKVNASTTYYAVYTVVAKTESPAAADGSTSN